MLWKVLWIFRHSAKALYRDWLPAGGLFTLAGSLNRLNRVDHIVHNGIKLFYKQLEMFIFHILQDIDPLRIAP
jgi:hypothetical protein